MALLYLLDKEEDRPDSLGAPVSVRSVAIVFQLTASARLVAELAGMRD